jgi:tripartite-type tricarboxylate transporter receptor subunit TctC
MAMIMEWREKKSDILGFFVLAFLVAVSPIHHAAFAQENYPNRPIKIIVPYDPGGIQDLGIRAMTDNLTQELKVPLVIENKSGAGGMLGAATIPKTKPDGYTLLAAGQGTMITSPLISANPPYDSFKDFSLICNYGVSPVSFGVVGSSPFANMADAVRYAKQNPGKITCGVTSLGSGTHLCFEAFKKVAEANMKLVPYRGTGEAIAALLGKHIDMLVLTYVAFLPYVKSNEVRILAVSDSIPGSSIPTLIEMGYAQSKMGIFNAIYGPPNLPKPINDRLVSTNPEVTKKWDNIGLIPDYMDSAELTAFMKGQWQIASKLVDELGLKGK